MEKHDVRIRRGKVNHHRDQGIIIQDMLAWRRGNSTPQRMWGTCKQLVSWKADRKELQVYEGQQHWLIQLWMIQRIEKSKITKCARKVLSKLLTTTYLNQNYMYKNKMTSHSGSLCLFWPKENGYIWLLFTMITISIYFTFCKGLKVCWRKTSAQLWPTVALSERKT